LIVDIALAGYYTVQTYTYNPNIANSEDESNKAISASSSSSTSTFGGGSISDIIKKVGGSTLKTEAQRTASESLAAKIIAKQRAKNSSKKK
jgi:hypothetical protein